MTTSTQTNPLASLQSLLETHFYRPDFQAIRIVLAAVASHYLKLGDPAWLFAVAPPGTGKTSMSIMGAAGLPGVHTLSDVTESTFLSGFHGAQTPGLLEKLGKVTQEGQTFTTTGDGVILMKDFTTVLSMRREKRAAILSQLREIHDGQYRRDFGTGVTKLWKGRLTVVAAVTPALDRHYSIFSTLGERFLQVRWHRPDSAEAGEWAIRQQGTELNIQKESREIVRAIFGSLPKTSPVLSPAMQRRLAALAEILAIGRTHIYRSSYGDRDIEYVPESEANTRISKTLAAVARGIAALNGHSQVEDADMVDANRVGLDSLPTNRRRLLISIANGKDPQLLHMATTVRNRELEELEALGMIKETNAGLNYELSRGISQHFETAGVLGTRESVSQSVR
jgi:hypothetical protein